MALKSASIQTSPFLKIFVYLISSFAEDRDFFSTLVLSVTLIFSNKNPKYLREGHHLVSKNVRLLGSTHNYSTTFRQVIVFGSTSIYEILVYSEENWPRKCGGTWANAEFSQPCTPIFGVVYLFCLPTVIFQKCFKPQQRMDKKTASGFQFKFQI